MILLTIYDCESVYLLIARELVFLQLLVLERGRKLWYIEVLRSHFFGYVMRIFGTFYAFSG